MVTKVIVKFHNTTIDMNGINVLYNGTIELKKLYKSHDTVKICHDLQQLLTNTSIGKKIDENESVAFNSAGYLGNNINNAINSKELFIRQPVYTSTKYYIGNKRHQYLEVFVYNVQ